jgi:hypothetical protein
MLSLSLSVFHSFFSSIHRATIIGIVIEVSKLSGSSSNTSSDKQTTTAKDRESVVIKIREWLLIKRLPTLPLKNTSSFCCVSQRMALFEACLPARHCSHISRRSRYILTKETE